MEPASDPSTLWLSIAREAFAPERSAAEVADTLERLGRQRGLGGGFAPGLRELVSYASAGPDPAQAPERTPNRRDTTGVPQGGRDAVR